MKSISWNIVVRDLIIKAAKSIDAASDLYEQFWNDPLIDYDEVYDGEDEW